jgi:hypothetical protein
VPSRARRRLAASAVRGRARYRTERGPTVSDRLARRAQRRDAEGPTHPRVAAIVMMVAVVIAIVVLAAMNTFGSH